MWKGLTNVCWKFEIGAVQRNANLVDLEKCCKLRLLSISEVSIQKRTSPLKFAHLAEKSENGSVSNLSTKVHAVLLLRGGRGRRAVDRRYARYARVGSLQVQLEVRARDFVRSRWRRDTPEKGMANTILGGGVGGHTGRSHETYVGSPTQLSNYLTLKGSFSAVSKPNFASKYALE